MARPFPVLAQDPGVMRTTGWADYELIDSGGGRKLERYGPYRVARPEPQCLWTPRLEDWAADATFDPEGEEDAGRWRFSRPLERFRQKWTRLLRVPKRDQQRLFRRVAIASPRKDYGTRR